MADTRAGEREMRERSGRHRYMSNQHGQFNWVDLMAHDMASAAEFYEGLFGWKSEQQDTQGGPAYVCFTIDGEHVAGLGQMNDEMKAT